MDIISTAKYVQCIFGVSITVSTEKVTTPHVGNRHDSIGLYSVQIIDLQRDLSRDHEAYLEMAII